MLHIFYLSLLVTTSLIFIYLFIYVLDTHMQRSPLLAEEQKKKLLLALSGQTTKYNITVRMAIALLEQSFFNGGCGRGNSHPQETFGKIQFWSSQCGQERVVEVRDATKHAIVHNRRVPKTENYLTQDVNSAKVSNPALEPKINKCLVCSVIWIFKLYTNSFKNACKSLLLKLPHQKKLGIYKSNSSHQLPFFLLK